MTLPQLGSSHAFGSTCTAAPAVPEPRQAAAAAAACRAASITLPVWALNGPCSMGLRASPVSSSAEAWPLPLLEQHCTARASLAAMGAAGACRGWRRLCDDAAAQQGLLLLCCCDGLAQCVSADTPELLVAPPPPCVNLMAECPLPVGCPDARHGADAAAAAAPESPAACPDAGKCCTQALTGQAGVEVRLVMCSNSSAVWCIPTTPKSPTSGGPGFSSRSELVLSSGTAQAPPLQPPPAAAASAVLPPPGLDAALPTSNGPAGSSSSLTCRRSTSAVTRTPASCVITGTSQQHSSATGPEACGSSSSTACAVWPGCSWPHDGLIFRPIRPTPAAAGVMVAAAAAASRASARAYPGSCCSRCSCSWLSCTTRQLNVSGRAELLCIVTACRWGTPRYA
jgi:hypothetical protein